MSYCVLELRPPHRRMDVIMQTYRMDETVSVADQAAAETTAYLQALTETDWVENVEGVIAYQAIDVDLLWRSKEGRTVLIEVKGDRYYQTGNYFFETISNKERGTPGCFLYTEAEYVFYYFVDVRELHVLPMPEVRDWFVKHLDQFSEKETSTPTRRGEAYITVGRLVPRNVVKKQFPNIRVIKLAPKKGA